jgi:phosphatidylglycerophosphatase A
MRLHTFFVTFNLPASRNRFIAAAIGTAVTFAWIATLGMQTYAMALFALSVIAVFESQKYFNRTGTLDAIAVDKALGAAYASYIAYSVAPGLFGWIGAITALGIFLYFDLNAPSTIGWLRRRVPNGFGLCISTLLAGIAAGLGGALLNTLLLRAVVS